MKKGEGDLWEITLDVAPGTYRYRIDVDGVPVVDPRNPAVSESFGNAWSLVRVPGAAFMDTADVPHGAVAAVTYHSKTVGKTRRAHVYTPPGYETGTDKYPVFYLLHGAGDCDDSWTSVGRAHDILDNLIAAKKAVPMIVVMPAGHDSKFAFGRPTGDAAPAARFEDDFEKDLRPHIEKTYRVKTDRANRAIAGLSMGGLQTLNIFAAKPADYSARRGVQLGGVRQQGGAGSVGEAAHRGAVRRRGQGRPEGVLVRHRQGRLRPEQHEGARSSCSRSWDSNRSTRRRPAGTPGSTGSST